MRRFATILFVPILSAMPLLAGGCVQQDQYDQTLMANKSLKEQLVSVEEQRDQAKSNLDTVRESLGRATSELNALKTKYNLVDSDLQKMLSDNDSLLKRVQGLDFGPLPEEMSKALQDLASQNPEMLTFDAKHGMLRFASDFTFASGSAELTSSASASMTTLAKILDSPTASNFEARIVGHTDNVPISKPETRAKHPTNWYLSAHRAIAVGSALISSGVNPVRIQVAGCGEYRPIVPNPAKGGAAQNRRVEIYLVPMHDMQMGAASSKVVAQPKETDEPMK